LQGIDGFGAGSEEWAQRLGAGVARERHAGWDEWDSRGGRLAGTPWLLEFGRVCEGGETQVLVAMVSEELYRVRYRLCLYPVGVELF
jgi:hypothetical protein